MESIELISTPHTLGLDIAPNEGDIAIVSIDSFGTPGRLNRLVLAEYGYSEKDLPTKEALGYGFSAIPSRDRKSILFVVTVGGKNTANNLEENLYNTLREFRGWISDKKIWLPLMGTGDGGLTLEDSYSITVRVINKFQEEHPTSTTILLSIPGSAKGRDFFKRISEAKGNELTNPDIENYIKQFKGRFYLVGSIWNRADQSQRFFEEGIWEKGHEDESYSDLINGVEKNDILIIKSTYASDGISYLRVKAFGVVTENAQDGATLSVNWKIKGISHDIEDLGFYRNTIYEVSIDDILTILSVLDNDHLK